MGVAEPDIDDLLQEVLLTAYKTLDRFDPTWHPPQTEAGVAADPARRDGPHQHRSAEARWVFGIAWRKVSHYLDRAHRRRELAHGLLPASCSEAVDPAPLSEERAVERERLELVIDLLWTLAPERRLVLVLHEAYEVPLVDIARDLGINYNTASSRLRLARADYRAAVRRLRPEQREALRASWLGFPLASAFLVHEDAGAIVPVAAEGASPAPAPPLPAPPAHAPLAPPPAGLAGSHPWLGEVGRALGWTAAGAGGTLVLLLLFAPPRSLWADRFGALVTELPRARSASVVEMTQRATPAPQPIASAPDVTSRRDLAPPPARDIALRPTPSASAREDSFAEEYRVLDAVQARISAGDPAGALRQLALHEQRFPNGRLRSARERLRELAQMRLAGPAEGEAREEPSR